MALAEAVPLTVARNDAEIQKCLRVRDSSDSELAKVLFESQKNGYYRVFGTRSLAEYLRERFRGTELDGVARLHARGVQRLIREYRLALEIPAFAASFDKISRSNRRLIAQVLTLANAVEWITKAMLLTTRELEALVGKKERQAPSLVRKKLILTPEQHEVIQEALGIAGRLLAEDGQDPLSSEGGRFVTICQEFIATYGEPGAQRAFVVAECPRCAQVSALHRTPGEDPADGRRVITYECGQCRASIAVVSV